MTIAEEIVAAVGRLTESQRVQLLRYARSIHSRKDHPRGVKIEDLMISIDPISAETARELEKIIEEGCERIDEDGR